MQMSTGFAHTTSLPFHAPPRFAAKPTPETKPAESLTKTVKKGTQSPWLHHLTLVLTGLTSGFLGHAIADGVNNSNPWTNNAPTTQGPHKGTLVAGSHPVADPEKANTYNVKFIQDIFSTENLQTRLEIEKRLENGELEKAGSQDELNVGLVKHTFPATVVVTATRTVNKNYVDQWGRHFTRPEAVQQSGTGFFISQDGYFLTNTHVIADDNKQNPVNTVKITLLDGRVLNATRIANDANIDIALFKLDGEYKNLPFLKIAAAAETGQAVMIAGHPEMDGWSAMFGKISNDYRLSQTAIVHVQTDADFDNGISGGPLVNTKGEVVGINTYMTGEDGGTVRGFSIRYDVISQYIQRNLPKAAATRETNKVIPADKSIPPEAKPEQKEKTVV